MKNDNSSAAHSHASTDLLNRLSALVLEAEKLIGASSPDGAEGTAASLRSRFNSAQERVAGIYSDARKRIASGARHTDESIRANPYQSMAIAAGIGLLCGVLLGRRTK
jgi:ElaB/YqjD/DUF883 family membrane-anchored ribosome-binding protein